MEDKAVTTMTKEEILNSPVHRLVGSENVVLNESGNVAFNDSDLHVKAAFNELEDSLK